jgi:hypothetical protein
MITFKQFLNEDISASRYGPAKGVTQSISPEAFVKWCETNATHYLKGSKDKMLFRGMPEDIKIGLCDTNKLNRKSLNTYNYYTIWMDNNPEWKNYPKRSKSLCCATSFNSASEMGYGSTFLIIPADDAKMGVCPEIDLWYGFKQLDKIFDADPKYRGTLEEYMNDFQKMFEAVLGENDPDYKNIENDYAALCSCLKRVTLESLKEANQKTKGGFMDAVKVFEKYGYTSMYEVFQKGFDPKVNKFKVYTGHGYRPPPTNQEVWIQGNCAILKIESEDENDETEEDEEENPMGGKIIKQHDVINEFLKKHFDHVSFK